MVLWHTLILEASKLQAIHRLRKEAGGIARMSERNSSRQATDDIS